jgi:hypothetical protein
MTWLEDKNGNKCSGRKMAVLSVAIAADFFRSLGFVVIGENKSVNANGTDLVIKRDSKAYNVEVKAVHFSSRSWQVSKFIKNTDDLVAIVFPSGIVQIESARDFRSLCPPKGARKITEVAHIINKNSDMKRLAEEDAKLNTVLA